jgi:hypothetical protein
VHRREWRFDGPTLTIIDTVAGVQTLPALARLHLGQGVAAEADAPGQSGRLITPTGRRVRWLSSSTAWIEPAEWSPEFGRRAPAQTLIACLDAGALSMTLDWS